MEAWRDQALPLVAKAPGAGTRWVTRERPRIDRIACPWLVRRFIDANAQFLYVPTEQVAAVAAREVAIAYDVAPRVASTLFTRLPVYDALYAWCRDAVAAQYEKHNWKPA